MSEKFRILIVDDDRLVLDLMMHAARRHPILEPEKLNDPLEALEKIRENPPYHIVLTDLSMPRVSGLEVLRTARTRSPDTRGIIVTGFGDKESTREAIKLGVSDYLNKPFRIEEMDLALRKAIAHFQLRQRKVDLETELGAARQALRNRQAHLDMLRGEREQIAGELGQFRQQAVDARERARVLMQTVADKSPAGAPISRDLLEANSLVRQKQMTEEEFRTMKKNLINRAYKRFVG